MRGKKYLSIIICLIIVLLIGAGLALYPVISNWYAEQVQSTVEAQYNSAVTQLDNSELQEALRAAQEYNESLYNIQLDPETEIADYNDLLNLAGNGIMGYIEIPAIDVNLPIYHGVSDDVLQHGAGHMHGTSLPIGGENTHAVISAHSGMTSARMFTDLDQLVKGDLFFLHVLDQTLAYEIDQITVAEPADIDSIQIVRGKDFVTLITCTPYGINTHRLLVRGHRIELTEDEIAATETTVTAQTSTWMQKYFEGLFFGLVISVILFIILEITLFTLRKRRNKSEENRK